MIKIRYAVLTCYVILSMLYIAYTCFLFFRFTIYESGFNEGIGAAVQQTMALAEQKPCEEISIRSNNKEVKLIESGCLEKKNKAEEKK